MSIFIFGWFTSIAFAKHILPDGFVYLKDIDPSIRQEIRYAGYHNFRGRPLQGYKAAKCILTRPAAQALHRAQMELKKYSLSLKVYDCYRPQSATNDFITWSKRENEQQMKAEFYPLVDKANVFDLGYVSKKSGHSRGSTVDLTLVPMPTPHEPPYHPGQKLYPCFADKNIRYPDNSIDMGTGFDCFSEKAYGNSKAVSFIAFQNRQKLRRLMEKYGFEPYEKEWWHFTLKNEPYPDTYFNFPVN